jgi:hypothetical protein
MNLEHIQKDLMMKAKKATTLRLDLKSGVSFFNLAICNKCDVFMIPFTTLLWHGLFYLGI